MKWIDFIIGKNVATISSRALYVKLSNGNKPFLVDVREPVEYRYAHVPGAKLIPLGKLSNRLDEIPKDREVVCICATGHRSVPAARILNKSGYSASSMKNGMIAWEMAKLPVKQGMQE